MAILRKDRSERQGQQPAEQSALARPEPAQLPAQLMLRDPFQLMREMMIDPFRMLRQLAPWADLGAREGREVIWSPSFEVRETDDAFVLKGDLPGVRREDVDVSVVGDTLQISGKREEEQEQEQGTLHAYERCYGQFSRSFTLPETADLDRVSCDLRDGVLTLVAPKKAGAPHRRKIPIGSEAKA